MMLLLDADGGGSFVVKGLINLINLYYSELS